MHLEEVRIYGFKTFKEDTRIVLSSKVSCIVGPNGSGKSNVVDAVRWALGEHRLSLLRAKEASDLIFSGSAFKKRLSVASVKLIFNNEDHVFSVKTPRVIIERRLYRSKESRYFVNDEETRFQDVIELFYTAGIYGHMYAIVGQGKINELLLARPEQKKTLIDHVAGVEVFRKRKKEALRKLEETERNLMRVKDRFHELKKLATRVTTEAKKAHLYYTVKDRLKHLEDTILNSEIQQLEREVVYLQSGINEVNKDLEHIIDSTTKRKKEETDILKEEEGLEKDRGILRDKKENILVKKTKLLEKEKYLREKRENFLERQENLKLEVEHKKRNINVLLKDVENLSKEKDDLMRTLGKESNEIERMKQDISAMELSIIPLTREVEESKKAIELMREERVKKEKLLSVIESDIKYIEEEVSELELNVQNVENLEDMDTSVIRERIDKAYSVKKELETRKKEVEGKLILLRYKIKEDKKFISERANTKKKQYKEGMLGNVVRLKEDIAGIEEELKMNILPTVNELKNNKKDKFFIKEDLINIGERKVENVKPISSIVDGDKGFLKGIYVAEDLADGRVFFKKYYDKLFIRKIITKDGFVLYSPYEVWIKNDIIEQEKIKELKKKNKQYGMINESLEKNKSDISRNNYLISSLQKELDRANKIVARKKKLAEAKERLFELEANLDKKRKEKGIIKHKIQLLLKKVKASDKEKLLTIKKDKIQSLRKEIQEKILKLTEKKYKLEKISNELADMDMNIISYKNEISKLNSEQEGILEEIKTITNELHVVEKALHGISLDIKVLEDENNALDDRANRVGQERKRIAVEIMRLNEQKEELLKKIGKQRIAIAEKNTRIENIKSSMEEKGIERREIAYEVNRETLKGEIKELKEKMKSLGAIDFTSLQEEEKIVNELKEKEAVYKDVLDSKRKIEKFIKKMDIRIKEEFEDTLNKVDKLFFQFFKRMFQGGEASIERFYDDCEEVNGVELSIRLPGRKKQSLPLLSGGEKTLTALAFLFAIFKVKPAPFYILDEVDAALDEENVARFGKLLEEESDFAQFIVITHNRETMQKADILYGITMEEEGVSKVISLKIV